MTPAEWSRLQGFLGDLMRAISAVTALRGGDESSWSLVKSVPVREFDHRPLLDVVAEARVDEALTISLLLEMGSPADIQRGRCQTSM